MSPHVTRDMGKAQTGEVMESLEKIQNRRAKAGRMVAGIAGVGNSDLFKGPSSEKPVAKDWSAIFSTESLSRSPCVLKQASAYLNRPGIISLGGGLPSSEYFPYSEIAMQLPKPPHFEDQASSSEDGLSDATVIGKHDARDGISEYDLSIALNYGQATGSPQLVRFLTEHTELIFNPPYADWQICATAGSTSSTESAMRVLCDRNRGDTILVEEYTYPSALQTMRPQGIKVVGVAMNEEGMLPSDMDAILSNWDTDARGSRKPHILYTVPCGQNPTGATQSLERRNEIYKVCQKHDIFILEDDPYYFLQMQPYHGVSVPANETLQEFVSSLAPSFLSLDVDGRVLRMDSFSKVLIPGSRVGWITASKQVVGRFLQHAEVANQGPGGLAQIVVWKLLDDQWGHEGYLRWLMNLKVNYTKRRNTLLAACDTELPRDLVTWTPPLAGMFLWLKLDLSKHPRYPERSILELEDEIFHAALESGVLCAKGSWFRAEPETTPKDLFLRVTFASATEEAMGMAIGRLSTAIKSSFGVAA
jgi:aromatic amino acid aminotransferase I